MKKTGKIIGIIAVIVFLTVIVFFVGGRDNTPIVSGIIDTKEYSDYKEFDELATVNSLSIDDHVIFSMHFIESPTGKKYDIKWLIDASQVQSETVEVIKGTQGVLTSELQSANRKAGTVRVEVYNAGQDKILFSKETKLN